MTLFYHFNIIQKQKDSDKLIKTLIMKIAYY